MLMLRTMQKARYDEQDLGHFGLAAEHYTHFTSPIRRYPDLVVHRTLREQRQGLATEEKLREREEELPEVARHTSEMERRANEAERELTQLKKVRFMADKVGEEFDGFIIGVAPFGLFVELIDHFAVADRLLGRRERVNLAELGPRDRQHLGRRIELHRARAERDHRAVEREVLVGEAADVAQHLGLAVVGVEHRMREHVAAAA